MDNLHVAGIPDSALLAARLRDAVGPGGVVHLFNGADEAIGFVARGEVDCSVIAVEKEASLGFLARSLASGLASAL